MSRRRLTPLVLGLVLFAGVALFGWRKLLAWQGPELFVGLTLCLAYLAWILWEARVSVRDSKAKSVKKDLWTAEAYATAQGATVLSALWFESYWPSRSLVFVLLGAVTFAVGVGLRLSAVRTLGAFYSHRVQVLDRHQVVQNGPYARIRHPAYAGMLLAHLGFVLCFFNWISVFVLGAGLVPAICARIYIEEHALMSTPGYREFCETRARLVPGVW